MSKEEICQRLVDVCNTLNSLPVTGVMNASRLVESHSILREIVSYLLGCEIISPEENQETSKDGGK